MTYHQSFKRGSTDDKHLVSLDHSIPRKASGGKQSCLLLSFSNASVFYITILPRRTDRKGAQNANVGFNPLPPAV